MDEAEAEADRTFEFLAKRGQEEQVAEVLRGLGMTPELRWGTYLRGAWGGDGCLITAPIPDGMSRRSIDKALFSAGVPGARRGD